MERVLAYRPSLAMVVALLALFVALGGSAFAALTLPKHSVGAKQLKNGAVTGAKLHDNAVTSSKVKNHSLLAKDFKAGQLPSASTSDSGAVLSGRVNRLGTANNSINWGAASGISTAVTGSDASVSTLSPDQNLVARDLSVRLTAAPGTNATRAVRLAVNGVSTELSCSMLDVATTCSAAGPVAVPAGSTLSIREQVPSTINGPSAAASDLLFAFTLTQS
jgi:hypothetical protein